MEMEEIQTQGCSKFPRISNGNGRIIESSPKIGGHKGDEQFPDDDDDGGGGGGSRGGGGGLNIRSSHGVGSLCGWPSSRIVRVSRASGGKDRHSKVLTSKGLRDRRVRLSVNTAIQFYDLQDRLGYDQPSKAVEWLLKAAAPSIAELPSLKPPFSDGQDSAEIEMEGDQNMQQQQLSKSCSSASETSKGSGGLSLSRSESRVKARERARERAAEKEKEKVKENEPNANLNPPISSSSFTELLTGTANKSPRQQWCSTPMDYFTSGLLCQSSTRAMDPPNIHLTNPLHHHFNMGGELQHFSFVSDHLAPAANNLNFSISPSTSSTGLAAFNNRGTLQSNSSSPSLLPHFQRFPPLDGSSSPTFFTVAATTAPNNAASLDNHHHFLPGFDARLQLYYGDAHAARHSDHKGKGKN